VDYPANMAIAYHPKFEYVAVDVAGAVYIVAAELLKSPPKNAAGMIPTRLRLSPAQPSSTPSSAILSWSAIPSAFSRPRHPRASTGAVHTAPGHGQEDYVIGRQYGIEIFCPWMPAAVFPRRRRRRRLPKN